MDGLDRKSRPHGASRLIVRLKGAAWETMREVNRAERQKLCGEDGVKLLLTYLDTSVLDLPIPEAGRWLKTFLFGQKRLAGGSMQVYVGKNRAERMKLEYLIQKAEKRDQHKIVLRATGAEVLGDTRKGDWLPANMKPACGTETIEAAHDRTVKVVQGQRTVDESMGGADEQFVQQPALAVCHRYGWVPLRLLQGAQGWQCAPTEGDGGSRTARGTRRSDL